MMAMLLRRLAGVPVLLLLVSLGIFSMISLVPGDPATTLAGGENATPERIAEVRTELGLDDPFLVQYGRWLSGAVRLDFGDSLLTGQSVMDETRDRLPVTLPIVILAIGIGLLVGIPAGIVSGMRPGSLRDRVGMLGASIGIAVPNFWLAMVLISVLSVRLGWLPAFGFTRFSESPVEWLKSSIMPACALAVFPAAVVARQLRAGLISVMNSAYIRTAWAKGASARRVVGKHALKNAATAPVTVLGLQFAALLGGSVIIESIFSIPGLGTHLLDATVSGDLPVVQGIAMFFVLINVGLTLALDATYGYLNPKVRVT